MGRCGAPTPCLPSMKTNYQYYETIQNFFVHSSYYAARYGLFQRRACSITCRW